MALFLNTRRMNTIDVIVETPKGCAIKYKYEPHYKMFKFHKAMPEGMVFPYDFGFIPDTKGQDGDPLDVLVVSEFTTFPGCLITCKIAGAITAEQTEVSGKKIRNDRYIGIPEKSKMFSNINNINDLPKKVLNELEHFFKSYTSIEGKQFKPLERINAQQAFDLITNNKNGRINT